MLKLFFQIALNPKYFQFGINKNGAVPISATFQTILNSFNVSPKCNNNLPLAENTLQNFYGSFWDNQKYVQDRDGKRKILFPK